MLTHRHIAWFLVRVLVIYALLVAPWWLLADSYAAAYRSSSNAAFGSFGAEGLVRFRPSEDGQRLGDTTIELRRRGCPKIGKLPLDTRLTGYLATIEVLALIAATILPWRRKLKAMLWGVLLIHGFIGLRLSITLLSMFCRDWPGALYSPGPLVGEILNSVHELVCVSPTPSFVTPVFIWILVTFRQADVSRFAGGSHEDSQADARLDLRTP